MSKTILIVDDDQTLVVPLKDGLESAGYRVTAAFDAAEGLRLAREIKPDLIILDYYMPGGDGGWVYKRLREASATAGIPIVFSTGVTLEELSGKVALDEKTYFMKKPVGLFGILSIVNGVLSEEVPESRRVAGGVPVLPPAKRARKAKVGAKAKHSEFDVRVTYADTDKLGIIYYANYFKFFEQGRTELLRTLGVRYRDLEIQRKLYLPAVDAHCRYLAPSRYDDLLTVRTWIAELGKASISFECDMVDKNLGAVVARGASRHAVVNDLWRTTRIPDDLRALLAPYVGRGPGLHV